MGGSGNDVITGDVGVDSITGGGYQDKLEEVSLNHIAENIYDHRVITENEYLELFDRDNAYLKNWETERKKAFIFDSAKAREETVNREVNWGPDVGREILSEDC